MWDDLWALFARCDREKPLMASRYVPYTPVHNLLICDDRSGNLIGDEDNEWVLASWDAAPDWAPAIAALTAYLAQ